MPSPEVDQDDASGAELAFELREQRDELVAQLKRGLRTGRVIVIDIKQVRRQVLGNDEAEGAAKMHKAIPLRSPSRLGRTDIGNGDKKLS